MNAHVVRLGIVAVILLFTSQLSNRVSKNGQVYLTVLTSDEYVISAKVLGVSLRENKATKEFVVLVSERVSDQKVAELRKLGFKVLYIESISNPKMDQLSLDKGNERWLDTYTKLRAWDVPYSKVVFIDADSVVIDNIDELFSYNEFAAAPECCDRFNSGVFVASPSQTTFQDMLSKIATLPSYDNADQGFLNSYFTKWTQLSFKYNALQNHYVTDPRTWKMDEIKLIHYVKYKPWQQESIDPKMLESLKAIHSYWWKYYDKVQELESM